jgi:Arc-like DNA binding domain
MHKETVKLNLCLPPDLHQKLKAVAVAEDRSLQREILRRLTRSLADDSVKAA